MVDCGGKKTSKGVKQRTDGEQTKIRREKKYGRHTSSILGSKGVGCAIV